MSAAVPPLVAGYPHLHLCAPFPIIDSGAVKARWSTWPLDERNRDIYRKPPMPMWSIYVLRGDNRPDRYAVRRVDTYPGRVVERPGVTITDSFEEARDRVPGFLDGAPVPIAAGPGDDPALLETWF